MCDSLSARDIKYYDWTSRVSVLAFLGLYLVKYLITSIKKIGTKNTARTVAESIPPITQIPISLRPAAPAPVLMASGSTPSMNANDVINIGRKRMRDASITDSDKRCPLSYNSLANSTIRIAFLAERPIVV